VLAALRDPLAVAIGPDLLLDLMPVGAGVLYLVAIVAFAAHAGPRIVSFRTLPRPEHTSGKTD
jgi:hypothetical protein